MIVVFRGHGYIEILKPSSCFECAAARVFLMPSLMLVLSVFWLSRESGRFFAEHVSERVSPGRHSSVSRPKVTTGAHWTTGGIS